MHISIYVYVYTCTKINFNRYVDEGLICTVIHCRALQHSATHCSNCCTLHHTAVHCNTCSTLQHTATHCNTLTLLSLCNAFFSGCLKRQKHQRSGNQHRSRLPQNRWGGSHFTGKISFCFLFVSESIRKKATLLTKFRFFLFARKPHYWWNSVSPSVFLNIHLMQEMIPFSFSLHIFIWCKQKRKRPIWWWFFLFYLVSLLLHSRFTHYHWVMNTEFRLAQNRQGGSHFEKSVKSQIVMYKMCSVVHNNYQEKILQHTATHCSTLQHTATHYNTLLHTATQCFTLQHSATHCAHPNTTNSQKSAAYCLTQYILIASWRFENFYQAALDEECGEDA